MNYMFNKVTIIGMGLMGGSFGLALKKKRLALNVTGWGRNEARLRIARGMGAADAVTTDIQEAVNGADITVICLPVNMIAGCFKEIKPFLKARAIVTDMGSIKENMLKEIDDGCFVGAHPMAGSEKAGTENIRQGLYEKATCIITPVKKNNTTDVKKIISMFEAIGMKTCVMPPEAHDRAVAKISHMPHAAAFALARSQEKTIRNNPGIIGPGFKDTTRIAASTEDVWAGILLGNKKNVLAELKAYEKELYEFKKALNAGETKLKAYIKKARMLRELLNK